MNQQRTAKCLYTVVLAAHSDTCIDLDLSMSDPIRSWTLLGCLLGALMLSLLVLVLVCCGCGGSRDLTRNFRTHELVSYQALERGGPTGGSPLMRRKSTTSFAANKHAAPIVQLSLSASGCRENVMKSATGSTGLLVASSSTDEISDVEVKDGGASDGAARIPLLGARTFCNVAMVTDSGSAAMTNEAFGCGSPAKHVRIVLPSDSDEEGPDYV